MTRFEVTQIEFDFDDGFDDGFEDGIYTQEVIDEVLATTWDADNEEDLTNTSTAPAQWHLVSSTQAVTISQTPLQRQRINGSMLPPAVKAPPCTPPLTV